MNHASRANGETIRPRTKRGLRLAASLALGIAVSGSFYPRPAPGLKKAPSVTPTQQEPRRSPNNSLEAELICRAPAADAGRTRAA